MKPRFRAESVVVREELLILASCLLKPMSRNSLLVFGLRLGLDLGLAGQVLASYLADIVKLVNYSTLTATFNC